MFRVALATGSGALLLALVSTFAGRGSLAQFQFTVVPALWTLAVVAAASGWALGLRFARDPWVKVAFAAVALVLISIAPWPAIFVLSAGLCLELGSRRLPAAVPVVLAASGVLALLQLPAFWCGLMLNSADVAAARGYCHTLIPQLERRYERRGTYPPDLAELSIDVDDLPRLLDREHFYRAAGRRFEFSFRDPAKLDDGWFYDSEHGAWRPWPRRDNVARLTARSDS